ncbi:MAG: hypothetical protein EOM80_12735 [Erysipelotrichia bacterium]|nr:hypothetical protein [Erysipelotrichia bacterium]
MLDFIFKKFLPFGLARTLSLAGIPLLQFLIAGFCSKEEAGRFYLLSAMAFIASQIADLGISRAMPVIYADSDEKMHPCISEINILRWLSGILFGCLFLVVDRLGETTWNWHESGLLLLFFCSGRVILLGNQGYCHARQQYGMLLRGAFVHIVAAATFIGCCAAAGKFGSTAALAGLAVGVWAELVALDRPAAHPFKFTDFHWSEAFRVIWPYASVGAYTAVYNRIESVVAGKFLDPADLGIFGTLDSAFKLCIWPSYVSSQTLYPAVRDAIESKNTVQFMKHARQHFIASGLICLLAMIVSLIYWYVGFAHDMRITAAAAFLWVSLWISVPNAFMIPLYYSFRFEKAFANITFYTMLLRCLVAPLLAAGFGYVGLCSTHAFVSIIVLLIFWLKLRPAVRDFLKQTAPVESNG